MEGLSLKLNSSRLERFPLGFDWKQVGDSAYGWQMPYKALMMVLSGLKHGKLIGG